MGRSLTHVSRSQWCFLDHHLSPLHHRDTQSENLVLLLLSKSKNLWNLNSVWHGIKSRYPYLLGLGLIIHVVFLSLTFYCWPIRDASVGELFPKMDWGKTTCPFASLLGTEGQRIFYTLPETGATLATAIAALHGYFTAKVNVVVERHTFKKRVQLADESIIQYVTALRRLVATCEFASCDDIRDQLKIPAHVFVVDPHLATAPECPAI